MMHLLTYPPLIVEQRVTEYDESKEDWFQDWFLPTINKIDLRKISWEDILSKISETDSLSGKELNDFYSLCLKYNQPKTE
jgi:hypothetical protein